MSTESISVSGPKDILDLWLACRLDVAFDPSILTVDEAARYARLRQPRKRSEFELSRTLLHRLAPTTKRTSLSHSGGLVALAVGDPALGIGVDIEVHKSRDVMSLARFAFHPEEVQALARHANALELFYALWVLKESSAKALGLPLLEALRTCVFTIGRTIVAGVLPTKEPWQASVWHPRADATLAAVAVGSSNPLTVRLYEWPTGTRAIWSTAVTVSGGGATPP